jgi:hypothetical protein
MIMSALRRRSDWSGSATVYCWRMYKGFIVHLHDLMLHAGDCCGCNAIFAGHIALQLVHRRMAHQVNRFTGCDSNIEGVWRGLKDCIGAGRCFANLHLLSHRTRQVLMAHHERPMYEFHW